MQSLHKKKRKKNIFIYIILIVIFFAVDPFNIFGFVRSAIMVPLVPMVEFGFDIGSHFSDSGNMIFSIGTLYEQNQDLNNKVRQLESENATFGDVKNENDLLRKELELLPREQFDMIGADVVLRDPLGGDQWVMINRGQNDGVVIGKAVLVNENIFVGYIDEVDQKTARVRLITHPNSIVNIASVRTGSEAIAYGKHGLSVVVEDIKKDDDVINGDALITSNIGNIFPRGLSVGKVQNISTPTDELFQSANIILPVPLSNLRFVFVIK